MDDDLKMKGSTPLNIAIFVVGCLVFGGTMYGLTRTSSDQKETHQLEQASKDAKAAANTGDQDKGEFAKMEATGGPEGEAPVPASEATPSGSAPAAAPAAAAPDTGSGKPPPPPSASNDAATPPPDVTANASPVEPAAAETASAAAPAPSPPEPAASQPAMDTAAAAPPPAEPAAAAPSTDASSPAAGNAGTVAKADDKPNRPVKDKPKPSVMGVLTPWWEPSQASPFNVQFVGRSQDDKKIVILFNQDVDPSAVADQIRVVDAKGKPVASNWQSGANPRVLVNGDLKPGRYLVMIEPTLAGKQGQPMGVPVHGPVVLQPDSQTS